MANNARPLSPHLQVYKLPLTGIISITHRITGVMLAFGLVFFVYAVSAIANGSESYARVQDLMRGHFSQLIYWLFIYALLFHMCHGVRHLIWDTGRSFAKATLTRYALYELLASSILSLIAFILS